MVRHYQKFIARSIINAFLNIPILVYILLKSVIYALPDFHFCFRCSKFEWLKVNDGSYNVSYASICSSCNNIIDEDNA